jgi:hypothetical protein
MFRIEIDTDNAAFEGENLGAELSTRLAELAGKLGDMSREDFAVMSNRGTQFVIRDTNGNRVGAARVTGIEE